MSVLRLLNPQGIAGLAASLVLALLLVAAQVDVRHWRKESARFEQLFRAEAAGHAATVADVRAATESARAEDAANAARVEAAQSQINERTVNDLEARLADARARAQRLRLQPEAAAAAGRGGSAAMPELPATAGGADQAAGQDRLPDPDRLIATEQAIQLDELIKWVERQAAVDPNAQKRHAR